MNFLEDRVLNGLVGIHLLGYIIILGMRDAGKNNIKHGFILQDLINLKLDMTS